MKKHSMAQNLEEQIQEGNIERKMNEVIKRMQPWKATGEDGMPLYINKILTAAKKQLLKEIKEILTNREKMREADVRTVVVLIYKKKRGQEDPASYRPISLLITDYKITTAVVASFLKEFLPDWAIPKEQLAREKV